MSNADQALVDERLKELLAEPVLEGPEFWGRMYDLGLAWVHFEEGRGGLGISPSYQKGVSGSRAKGGRIPGQLLPQYPRNWNGWPGALGTWHTGAARPLVAQDVHDGGDLVSDVLRAGGWFRRRWAGYQGRARRR